MLPARPRLSLLLENFGLLFVFTRSLRTRERNSISARIHPQSIARASRSTPQARASTSPASRSSQQSAQSSRAASQESAG